MLLVDEWAILKHPYSYVFLAICWSILDWFCRIEFLGEEVVQCVIGSAVIVLWFWDSVLVPSSFNFVHLVRFARCTCSV